MSIISNVQGLWHDSFDAGELARILGPRTDELYWLIDVQSGPLDTTELEKLGDEDALIERYVLPIADLDMTSTRALRPSAISRLGSAICWGEWSYLVGFLAQAEEVESIVQARSAENLARQFWRIFERHGGIYVEDIDEGLAFTFTSHSEWFDLLRAARPQAKPMTVEEWWQQNIRRG